MAVILPWFLMLQSALFPQLGPGSEVRLVSADLVRVHARGELRQGVLDLSGSGLPAGREIRILVFPSGAKPEDEAAAMSGARAVHARVNAAGDGVLLFPQGGGDAVLWRTLLAEQGIELRLPAAVAAP